MDLDIALNKNGHFSKLTYISLVTVVTQYEQSFDFHGERGVGHLAHWDFSDFFRRSLSLIKLHGFSELLIAESKIFLKCATCVQENFTF